MPEISDHSPVSAASSVNTGITTPDQAEVDDVWASDNEGSTAGNEMLSDLPTVKRQHMTDGYREGLGVGKAQVMQQGFDQGYPIGISIACRVGRILGCLEGLLAMKTLSDSNRANLTKQYDHASRELVITSLLKDLDDQTLVKADDIPENVDKKILAWEVKVFGDSAGQSS